MKRSLHNEAGFTLVELLMAAVLGLIIMGTFLQLFISTQTNYRTNDQLARIQESGRFSVEFISQTARTVGFRGCAGSAATITNSLGATTYHYDFATPVEGHQYTGTTGTATTDWTPNLTAGAIGSPVAGSDIITFRGPDNSCQADIIAHTGFTANLEIDSSTTCIAPGDIVIAADCENVEVFQAVGSAMGGTNWELAHTQAGTPGNTGPNFIDTFENGSVMRMISTTYYVRNNPAGVPSLYRIQTTNTAGAAQAGTPEELVEGVESMQVVYGLDTDGDGALDSYDTANNVTDWEEVVSVRIGFLLRSPEENLKGEQDTFTYQVNGATIDPVDDFRMRQVMVTTMTLRNRVQ